VDTQILLGELNLESKVRALMLEVISVAAALGHSIDKSVVDQQIEITRPMGAYRPSSMIDFVDGRPVEVDAIWRKPLAVAQHLGLDVAEMEELCGRVVDKVDSIVVL
jgi:2-dehydropantoate 2-reductase